MKVAVKCETVETSRQKTSVNTFTSAGGQEVSAKPSEREAENVCTCAGLYVCEVNRRVCRV